MSLSVFNLGNGNSSNNGNTGGGDMYKSQYDPDNDGKVSAAEVADDSVLFDGQPPEFYLSLRNATDELPANLLPGSFKVVVEQPMTFYASPSGLDNNDGLTPLTPMSLRGVIDLLVDGYVIDKNVTIQLLDGTYELSALIAITNFDGNASLVISGNATNNAAVTITNSANQALTVSKTLILFNIIGTARFILQNITFAFSDLNNKNEVTFAYLMYCEDGCRVRIDNCRFENEGGYIVNATAIGLINYVFVLANEDLFFKGDFDNGILLINNARFTGNTGGSASTRIHFINTPNIDTFLSGSGASNFGMGDIAFVGTFVGKKFVISSNSIITSATHPNNLIPGTIDGEVLKWVGHAQNLLADVAFSGSYNDLSDRPTSTNSGTSYARFINVSDSGRIVQLADHGATYLVSAACTITLPDLSENVEVNVRSLTTGTINFVTSNGILRDPATGNLSSVSKNVHLQYNKSISTWYITGAIS